MLGILTALLSPLNFYAVDVSEELSCFALGACAPAAPSFSSVGGFDLSWGSFEDKIRRT